MPGSPDKVAASVPRWTCRGPASSDDAVLLAGGHRGYVGSHRIMGQTRGALSWTLARVLESFSPEVPWTFEHLVRHVQHAHSVFRLAQQPTLAPMRNPDARLGALLEEQPWGVPWRGVRADYQTDGRVVEHHGAGGGQLGNAIFGSIGDQQEWIWSSSSAGWNESQFELHVDHPGTPVPGNSEVFDNNGFSAYGGGLPTVGLQDRSFKVTIPSGDDTWVIVRDAANPTAIEWYTTFPGPHFDFQIGDVLTFTAQTPTSTDWGGRTWQWVSEARR